jgi:ribosome-binding factor A
MTRRQQRINDLLREEISDLIRRELKDPRIAGLVSITEVDVAPDLRQAKVYVSVLGTEQEKASTFEALGAAASFLYRELKHRLSIRRMPLLTFVPDDSIERGARIIALIDRQREDGQV